MKHSTLLSAARAAKSRAYAPYSQFPVGAALLTADGAVVTGSNVENSSLGLTVCAERSTILTAYHAGYRRFKSMALAADCSPPPTPCGACRQVLWELAGDIELVLGGSNGEVLTHSLAALLPFPFAGPGQPSGLLPEPQPGEETWRLPVHFTPVGFIASPYEEPGSVPGNYRELLTEVVIEPDFEEGLYRIEEEERISIITYLHQARGYTLKEKRSGRGDQVYGVFACRAPLRPNAIAQTTVELVERKANVLTVRGADLLNGTPVLDLKTILPGTGS